MDNGTVDLLPRVVCPACRGTRVIPLTVVTGRAAAETASGRGRRKPDAKCISCGAKFSRL